MSITIEKIEDISQSDSLSLRMKAVLEIIISAVNDWPNDIQTLEQFVDELEDFIRLPASKLNLEFALKKINLNTNAWKGESIADLLEIYHHFSVTLSVREIMAKIEEEFDK